jgi:hypothetical protein
MPSSKSAAKKTNEKGVKKHNETKKVAKKEKKAMVQKVKKAKAPVEHKPKAAPKKKVRNPSQLQIIHCFVIFRLSKLDLHPCTESFYVVSQRVYDFFFSFYRWYRHP